MLNRISCGIMFSTETYFLWSFVQNRVSAESYFVENRMNHILCKIILDKNKKKERIKINTFRKDRKDFAFIKRRGAKRYIPFIGTISFTIRQGRPFWYPLLIFSETQQPLRNTTLYNRFTQKNNLLVMMAWSVWWKIIIRNHLIEERRWTEWTKALATGTLLKLTTY